LAFPENTIIIWDSYFGTHECNVPLNILEKTGAYRLLNVFRPVPSKNSWYDPAYQICIFKKAPYGKFIDNKPIRDSIEAKNNEPQIIQFITGDTFEKNLKRKANEHISREFAMTGAYSYKANSWEEFILPYELDISNIIRQKKNVSIRVTCYVYPLVLFKENDTRLVITLKDKNEYYQSLPLDSVARQINQWNQVSFKATFPLIKSTDRLVVYFWHLGKKEFYIDNIKIERVVP
jgi:hypothetical protein